MKYSYNILLLAILNGCVAGPPHLSPIQIEKAEQLKTYTKNETIDMPYNEIDLIEAVDCTSIKGVSGHDTTALFNLKKKAVYLNADAIIKVSCRTAPLVNDCWAPKSCTGVAITWKK